MKISIDELIASYDEIDRLYESRFNTPESICLNPEDRGGHTRTGRKIDDKYMSFIPPREEVEKIFYLSALEKLRVGNSENHKIRN